jgi:membrane-associated phospholipid phosphatase
MNVSGEKIELRDTLLAVSRRLPFFHARWNEQYGWHAAAALAGLSGSLFVLTWLAERLVDDGTSFRWEARFNQWLDDEAWGPLVYFFRVVTIPGSTVFLVAVALAAAVLLWARNDRADTALVGLAFAGSAVVNFTLKVLFERPRPTFQDESLTLNTFSFPSGHASVSVAVYGAFAIIVLRDVRTWRGRALVLGTLAVLLALIGFSRIYLGAHFFSDVLAGYSLGTAWLMICVLALTVYEHRSREESGRTTDYVESRSSRTSP